MPLNPNIPLSVGSTNRVATPTEAMGRALTLRKLQMEYGAAQRQEADEIRAVQDEAAVRAAFQRYGNDSEKVLDALYRSSPGAAQKYETHLTTQRMNQAKELGEQLKNYQTQLQTAGQLVQGMGRENAGSVKAAIAGMFGPEMANGLPDPDDPDFDQKREAAISWGMTAAEYTNRINAARQAMELAYESGMQNVPGMPPGVRPGLKPETAQHFRVAAATILPMSKSEEEYQKGLMTLREWGVPASILAEFPAVWSPENMKRIELMGITPEKRAEEARLAATQAETARHNVATEAVSRGQLAVSQGRLALNRQQTAAGGGSAGLTPGQEATRKATAERWKQDQLQQLEKLAKPQGYDLPALLAPAELQIGRIRIENSYRIQVGEPVKKAEAEAWKRRQLALLEKEIAAGNTTAEDARAEKLRIQNEYLSAIGAPTAGELGPEWDRGTAPRSGQAQPEPTEAPAVATVEQVQSLLQKEKPGRYTLSDGSVWEKPASGPIVRVK